MSPGSQGRGALIRRIDGLGATPSEDQLEGMGVLNPESLTWNWNGRHLSP